MDDCDGDSDDNFEQEKAEPWIMIVIMTVMTKMIIMKKKRWKLGGSSSDGPDNGIAETAHTQSSSLQVC